MAFHQETDIESRLAALESIVRTNLELSPEAFAHLTQTATKYCSEQLQELERDDHLAWTPFDTESLLAKAAETFSTFPNDEQKEKSTDGAATNGMLHDDQQQQRFDQALLKDYHNVVYNVGYRPNSGKMLGYIGGGGIVSGALADLIAAVSNTCLGDHRVGGSGLQVLEKCLVEWLGKEVGFVSSSSSTSTSSSSSLPPPSGQFGGFLATGGSVATLSAIIAARDAFDIFSVENTRELPLRSSSSSSSSSSIPPSSSSGSKKTQTAKKKKYVAYFTPELHNCLFKAMHVAGCGENCPLIEKHYVAVDSEYRMDVSDLQRAVEEDLAKNNTGDDDDDDDDEQQLVVVPWLVAASAGTVNTGSVDNLEAIGNIAKKHKMWYHIDGAYGGMFSLCSRGREILGSRQGFPLADSLVCDPHKLLFLPYGTGLLLVRDEKALLRSHNFHDEAFAEFLEENNNCESGLMGQEEEDYIVTDSNLLSTELSKHNRAFRLWLSLRLFGVAPFRAAIEEKLVLAQYVAEKFLQRSDLFELAVKKPHLSVVVVRAKNINSTTNEKEEEESAADDGDVDAATKRLHTKLLERGKVFVSPCTLRGKLWLRLALVLFRTHRKHADIAVNEFIEICQGKC